MYNRITSKHIINIDVAIAIGRKGVFYIALTDNTFIIDLLPSPDKVVGIEIFISLFSFRYCLLIMFLYKRREAGNPAS